MLPSHMPLSDELADAFGRVLKRRNACVALAEQGHLKNDPLFRAALKSLEAAEAALDAVLDKGPAT